MDAQTIQIIINVVGAIVGSTGFSAIVVQGFKLLKQIGADKKLKNVDTLVQKAVTFASQKGINLSLNDDTMYRVALTWVKNEASKHGINYSDTEWEGFIESSYKLLKSSLNEAVTDANIDTQTITPETTLPTLEVPNDEFPVIPETLTNTETLVTPSIQTLTEITPETQNSQEITPDTTIIPVLNIPAIQSKVAIQIQELATKVATEAVQKIIDDATNLAVQNVTQAQ